MKTWLHFFMAWMIVFSFAMNQSLLAHPVSIMQTGGMEGTDPTEQLNIITIGDGTELPGTPHAPIDFYWKTSLSETIYLADEISQPAGSQITKISYQSNFSQTLLDKKITVYMGETDLTDLSGGWIISDDLEMVFDGTVSIPVGSHNMLIPLTSHYTYRGKNLVVMIYREKDDNIYNSSDRFYSSTDPAHTGRTLAIALDPIETFTLYPSNPPIHLTATDHFPNVALYMMPGSNTGIYSSSFESFLTPGQVACQEPYQWTTWDNEPCGPQDAVVSSDFSYGGMNSAKVEDATDLILHLGNRMTGKFELSFYMYVPSGFCGYYNLLQDFNAASSTFGLEVYFPSDGNGYVNANGQNAASFSYEHDLWIQVRHIIDLNNDIAELMIGGTTIHTWQWSEGATGLGGILRLSAADFFAGVSENYPEDTPRYYIDDLEYNALDASTCPDLSTFPESFSQIMMKNTTTSRTLKITNQGSINHSYSVDLDYLSKSESSPGDKRATVYYDQTGNPSAETGIISQTFVKDLPTRICAAADDFTVPSGQTWNIRHVFAAGEYVNYVIHGEVPLVDVVFYEDATGFPGDALYTFDSITCHSDIAGDVNVFLPTPVNLSEGTYWVSVAAHMSYSTNRYWYWSRQTGSIILNEFAWKNPPGGLSTNCITWCYGSTYQPDRVDRNLTFALSDSVYTMPENWLTVSPMNGTIPAGGSVNLTMNINPANVTGNHVSQMTIITDDEVNPLKQVPVNLRVTGEPGQMPLIEGWDATFPANKWELDPITIQWNVNTSNGNPKPEAWFFRPLNILDYSFSLMTRPLDAREILDNVTLVYEAKFQNPNTVETLECLSAEVYDGKDWKVIYTHKNTQRGFEYTKKKFDITHYVAGKIFNVRFRVHGANTSNFNVWELDNMMIYRQEVGNIEGMVTKLSNGSPVADATVTISNQQSGTYSAVTGINGSYSITGAEAGSYLLSIHKNGFNVLYDSIAIVFGQTLPGNYQLTYPTLSVDPESLTAHVPVNQTIQETVTLHNNGDGPVEWIGSVQSNPQKISLPKSDGNFPRGTAPASLERAQAKTSRPIESAKAGIRGTSGYAFDHFNGVIFSFDTEEPGTPTTISPFTNGAFAGTFDAYNTDFMYIIDVSNNHLTRVDMVTGAYTDIGKCNIVSGHLWTGMEIDRSTNTLYAVSAKTVLTESQLYTIDLNTAETTQIGSLGIKACIDIAIDGSGQMYGYDIVTDLAYKIDKTTAVSTPIGYVGFDANFAQGMSWDPVTDNIYLAAYNNWTECGELRIFDRESANTEFIGYFRGETDALSFPGGGATWFSINPPAGRIEPGSSQVVTITFDGSYINEDINPTVTGKLVFKPDVSVAYCDPATLDLTMMIQGPLLGILNGTATHGGLPLEGATITAVREDSPIDYVYSSVTGPDGIYNFNPTLYGKYTLTAEKEGFNLYSVAGIEVTGDQTTTHDIAMVAPTMNVNPLEINATTTQGETVTRTITISNGGDGRLDWRSFISANLGRISIPPSDGNFPRTNVPPSARPAPKVNKTVLPKAEDSNRGSLAYGFDLGEVYSFFSFDTDDPATKNIINTIDFLATGADFDAKNTTFMYVIDYDNFELKKIYLETGEVELIGPCVPREEHIWSGIAVDKLTNIMYGVSTNIDGSALYRIDMSTGEATDLGDIDMPAAIDCAIDGTGVMYSYCIVNKESYSINLETLETTDLGPIGFDANYAQGMAWDPSTDIIYLSAFNQETFAGELRILDRETGNTLLLGSFGSEVDGLAFPGVIPWFTVEPRYGTIQPWSQQEMTVTMYGDNVFAVKDYSLYGNIRLESDPEVGMLNIPVTLTVTPVEIPLLNKPDGMAVYPNPASDHVCIENDQPMRSVEVLSLTGQTVYSESNLNQKQVRVNLKGWNPGVYIIRIVAEKGVTYQQLTVTR